jgi:Flp pilus assembly protein TadG
MRRVGGRFSRSNNNQRRGAAAVEFAVVAPVMFMVIMGMFELGRAMSIQQVLTNAAREGARESTLIGATVASVTDVVEGYASAVSIDGVTTNVTPDPSTVTSGELVTTTVSVNYNPLSGYGVGWFGRDFQISAASTMRKEGFD